MPVISKLQHADLIFHHLKGTDKEKERIILSYQHIFSAYKLFKVGPGSVRIDPDPVQS